MEIIHIGHLTIAYNDPQDIQAILEVAILDVYDMGKIREGDTVLDLGAGIGEFSLLASKRVGESGLVISVEPNPQDYEALTQNLSVNGCQNVSTFNCAFSSSRAKKTLEFKGRYFTAESISLPEIKARLQEHGRYKLDSIKIDIEGDEVEALTVLKEYLEKTNYIMIELHGTKGEVDRILEPLSFKFRRFERKDFVRLVLFYFLRHPFISVRLWRTFNSSGGNSIFKKLSKGIFVTRSNEFMIGLYERQKN